LDEPLTKEDRVINLSGATSESPYMSQEVLMGEAEVKPAVKSVRQSNLRWLMLLFGCFFLMGSYFCYDNPTPIEKTLESEPYNLSTS
jgi:hypothetical protein